MNDINIIITLLAVSTAISIVLNAIIRNFAKENNFLMDIPDDIRKFHKRTTPLIGGIAICFSYVLSFGIAFVLSPELFSDSRLNYQVSIAIMSILVVATFIFDDLLNLKAALRILLQSFLVLTIIILTNVYVKELPNIFGFGEIPLGLFGIPFSVFCVVGIMNAFNMIDGLDGLCATISFNALLVVCLHCNAPLIALVLGSITGFVFYNMGIFGKKRKVFLGDAGSNLLGFITASMLIFFSKDLGHGVELGSMSAVTALWFVAIPLVDCIRVIIYRIQKGRKPFSADRIHFHYMLLDLGIEKNQIFWIYYGMSILFLLIGITFDKIFEDQIYFSFALFAFFSFVYLLYAKDLERRIKNVN